MPSKPVIPAHKAIGAAVAAFAGSMLAASTGMGAAAGSFDGLNGVWTGGGTLTYASGTEEQMSCRIQYRSSQRDNLQQTLRCAADSYSIQVSANLSSANGNLSGNWTEVVNNVGGSVSGTVTAGNISGDIRGPGFVATLNVWTKGDRQTVNIQVPASQIRSVSIEVRRSK